MIFLGKGGGGEGWNSVALVMVIFSYIIPDSKSATVQTPVYILVFIHSRSFGTIQVT